MLNNAVSAVYYRNDFVGVFLSIYNIEVRRTNVLTEIDFNGIVLQHKEYKKFMLPWMRHELLFIEENIAHGEWHSKTIEKILNYYKTSKAINLEQPV